VNTKQPISNRGFTLVELLVVISVIALLISILVPSLRGSRRLAKRTQCLARLKAVGIANMMYIGDGNSFPDLNNQPDDGTWQYNYLIYDGVDLDNNYGPLVRDGGELASPEQLYCPVQKDPFHMLATGVNPWPVRPLLDTRAGYGRRYHLSGKTLSQIPKTIGMAADVFHLPQVILSSHKISEIPVVDDLNRPIGLIDITDVIGLMPADDASDTIQNAG